MPKYYFGTGSEIKNLLQKNHELISISLNQEQKNIQFNYVVEIRFFKKFALR